MASKFCKIVVLFFFIFLNAQASEPLPVDQAFSFHLYAKSNTQLLAEWNIAPGYYLYRDKIHFISVLPMSVKLGSVILPRGKQKHDNFKGVYQVYTGKIKVSIPLLNPVQDNFNLDIIYQGCSSSGFCYAPVKKHWAINLAKAEVKETFSDKQILSEQDYITQLLIGQKFIFVILAFLGLGLLLSFTPCVLPMVPILSGIIVSHHSKKQLTTSKAFFLSLCYVLGMSFTYMILGVVIALLGSGVQAEMQKPWVIILFSSFFVLLALSLFGFYTFQFPASWQKHLMRWDRHFKSNTHSGIFLMGCFSSLIVSPCVSAPLVGVLAYIAQTGNVFLGAIAFFALGIGMGIPLLLVGTSAGKLLPRSGPWMISIQKIFGILMLGVAAWLFSRLIPGFVTVLLWALLLILSAIMLGAFKTAISTLEKCLKILGVAFFIYGIVLIISAGFKNSDPLHPWKMYSSQNYFQYTPSFTVLKSIEQLDQQLMLAKKNKKPVILDFYADWCGSCKIIDKKVFENSEVQAALKNFILLRADLTHDNQFDQMISKRFRVIAPPTVLFFNRDGKELSSQRFVGEFNPKQFIQHLQALGA